MAKVSRRNGAKANPKLIALEEEGVITEAPAGPEVQSPIQEAIKSLFQNDADARQAIAANLKDHTTYSNRGSDAKGGSMEKKSDQLKQGVDPSSITLPKGGGAICGIGEKFAANRVTCIGSMSVPIASSPRRSGFGPQLRLSSDSGSCHGPFGFGWSLSIPSITRKTDKGLPKY